VPSIDRDPDSSTGRLSFGRYEQANDQQHLLGHQPCEGSDPLAADAYFDCACLIVLDE
jgi:hypothetical protein